jgi:hypothetical protein
MKKQSFISPSKATDLLGDSGKKKQSCGHELAPTLSDDLWGGVILYCDVVHLPTFMALRSVNHAFKDAAEYLVETHIFNTLNAEKARQGEKYASAVLEFECRGSDDDHERGCSLTFRVGWSDEYHAREALIEKALQYCDPQAESQYDEVKARNSLEVQGSVDAADCMIHDEEYYEGYYKENAWNVKTDFRNSITLNEALSVAKMHLNKGFMEASDDEKRFTFLHLCFFYFLRLKSRATSVFRKANVQCVRHCPDWPSDGGKEVLQLESFCQEQKYECELEFSTDF